MHEMTFSDIEFVIKMAFIFEYIFLAISASCVDLFANICDSQSLRHFPLLYQIIALF